MSHSFFTTGIINAISRAGTLETRTLFFSLSAPVPRGRQHRSLSHALHLQPCRVFLPPFLWKVGASAWQAWAEAFPASFRPLNARCALRAVSSPDRISLAGPASVREDSVSSVGRGGIIAERSPRSGRLGIGSIAFVPSALRLGSATTGSGWRLLCCSRPCLFKGSSAKCSVGGLSTGKLHTRRVAVTGCCLGVLPFRRRFEYTRVSVLSGCLLRNEHAGGRVV